MATEVLWPLTTFFMGAGVMLLVAMVLVSRSRRRPIPFKEFCEIREGGYEYALEQGAQMIEECALDPDEKPHAARNARLLRRLKDAPRLHLEPPSISA